MRQRDDGKPEVVHGIHDLEEPIEAYGLGDVTVRMEKIAPQDIGVRGRGGLDYDWNAFQCYIFLDFLQNLPAILFREVQIE
jgi:hypothetical protein